MVYTFVGGAGFHQGWFILQVPRFWHWRMVWHDMYHWFIGFWTYHLRPDFLDCVWPIIFFADFLCGFHLYSVGITYRIMDVPIKYAGISRLQFCFHVVQWLQAMSYKWWGVCLKTYFFNILCFFPFISWKRYLFGCLLGLWFSSSHFGIEEVWKLLVMLIIVFAVSHSIFYITFFLFLFLFFIVLKSLDIVISFRLYLRLLVFFLSRWLTLLTKASVCF